MNKKRVDSFGLYMLALMRLLSLKFGVIYMLEELVKQGKISEKEATKLLKKFT